KHRTRNAAYGQPYRGFESLPLRQTAPSSIDCDGAKPAVGERSKSPLILQEDAALWCQRIFGRPVGDLGGPLRAPTAPISAAACADPLFTCSAQQARSLRAQRSDPRPRQRPCVCQSKEKQHCGVWSQRVSAGSSTPVARTDQTSRARSISKVIPRERLQRK